MFNLFCSQSYDKLSKLRHHKAKKYVRLLKLASTCFIFQRNGAHVLHLYLTLQSLLTQFGCNVTKKIWSGNLINPKPFLFCFYFGNVWRPSLINWETVEIFSKYAHLNMWKKKICSPYSYLFYWINLVRILFSENNNLIASTLGSWGLFFMVSLFCFLLILWFDSYCPFSFGLSDVCRQKISNMMRLDQFTVFKFSFRIPKFSLD